LRDARHDPHGAVAGRAREAVDFSVHFALTMFQDEAVTEDSVEGVPGITCDFQPAATQGAVLSERCDHGVSAGPKHSAHLRQIRGARRRLREKMKYGTIVPHVHARRRQVQRENVVGEPGHCISGAP